MDHQQILSYSVTGLGVLLCLFSFAFLFRGKRMAGDGAGPQIIEFKGLKVHTNSIIMLVLVSASVSVLPLGLMAYVATHTPPQPSSKTSSITRIFVNGQVHDKTGAGLPGAMIRAINTGTQQELGKEVTDDSGTFEMKLEFDRDKDRIKLITEKDGFKSHTIVLGTEVVSYPAVLVSK